MGLVNSGLAQGKPPSPAAAPLQEPLKLLDCRAMRAAAACEVSRRLLKWMHFGMGWTTWTRQLGCLYCQPMPGPHLHFPDPTESFEVSWFVRGMLGVLLWRMRGLADISSYSGDHLARQYGK